MNNFKKEKFYTFYALMIIFIIIGQTLIILLILNEIQGKDKVFLIRKIFVLIPASIHN